MVYSARSFREKWTKEEECRVWEWNLSKVTIKAGLAENVAYESILGE
jgi:hypothetical protein